MKHFLCFLIFSVAYGHADEYRFMCMGEVTGLCDQVYDQKGQATTVKLDFASPETAAVFLALQKKRIYGTKGFDDHLGVAWEQGVYLTGEFTSEIRRTKTMINSAPPEPYRQFKVTGLRLNFPVWRFQEILEDPTVDGAVMMEVHFGYETLFPKGLTLKDHSIDLTKFSRQRPSSR